MRMIRPYRRTDWLSVCRIYDRAKPYELRSAGIEASFVPLAQDEVRTREFSHYRVHVWAEEDDYIVGFAGYKGGYIGWLFVDPERSRRGIGRALLSYMVSEIEGAAWLWSMKSNEPALGLYRQLGFEVMAEKQTSNGGLPCMAVKLELQRRCT